MSIQKSKACPPTTRSIFDFVFNLLGLNASDYIPHNYGLGVEAPGGVADPANTRRRAARPAPRVPAV